MPRQSRALSWFAARSWKTIPITIAAAARMRAIAMPARHNMPTLYRHRASQDLAFSKGRQQSADCVFRACRNARRRQRSSSMLKPFLKRRLDQTQTGSRADLSRSGMIRMKIQPSIRPISACLIVAICVRPTPQSRKQRQWLPNR